jgi:hypothetical protein
MAVMLGALELFDLRFAGRPLLLFACLLGLLLVARRFRTSRSFRLTSPQAPGILKFRETFALVAAVAVLATYAIVAAWYASDPHFFDNAEPSVIAIGWLFHVGQPVYHLVDSAERYSHIYGPFAFIPHALVLAAFGPGIVTAKAMSAVAGIGSLALEYRALRLHDGLKRAVIFTGLCGLLLLLFRNYSFWTRPDPLELAALAASLWLANTGRNDVSAVATGLLSGVLWNVKFTGPLYSLPIFAMLHARTGWRGTLTAVGVALAVAGAPFVFLTNVSFANYLAWVRMSARTGLLLSTLRQNLEWAGFLSLPVLLSYYAVAPALRRSGSEWRIVLVALLVGILGVVVAAAKPGAGPYHLIPFIPIVVFVSARQSAGVSSPPSDPVVPIAALVFVVIASLVMLAQQAQFMTTMIERRSLDEVHDIETFATTHAGDVEMGYGSTESLSFERPVLVFRNSFYLIDQPAVREQQLQGLELPRATMDAIASCRVRYWLIPRGEEPFSARNGYAAVFLRPMFPEEFRNVFRATYRRVATTAYYDIWSCGETR